VKKVAVTGGGGFVGSAIVRQLLGRGIETIIISRDHYPELAELGARCCRGDIRDESFLNKAFVGCDTVFHVAALAGIWGRYNDYYSINVTGSKNVVAACHYNQIPRLIYTSTPSVVFKGDNLVGADESEPYARSFRCHYAATKAMAEEMVLAANSPALMTCAIRPHLVWGPGDTNLIPRLLARGRAGQLRQVGDGRNMVDISYIDNVGDAHLLAAENLATSAEAAGKAYFISQGEPVNLWNWINDLFNRLAVRPVTAKVSYPLAYGAGALCEAAYGLMGRQQEPRMTRFLAQQLAMSHWYSIDRARRDFSYKPKVSTAEGMDKMVAWLIRQEQGRQ